VGLHPPVGLSSAAQAADVLESGVLAERVGFDGVTLSEHHDGFPGYLPQPLLLCGLVLARTTHVWAGPCPLLLTLRDPVHVAEELAWTAAAFPGRVGAAFAPGYAAGDFEGFGLRFEDRAEEFGRRTRRLLDILAGKGPVASDPAVSAWRSAPGPLLGAANSVAAVRRAAGLGLGLVFPGGEEPARLGRLADDYRDAGGRGPVVWIRSTWIGEVSAAAREALDAPYRAAAGPAMRQAGGFRDGLLAGPAEAVVEGLVAGLRRTGATALNVRFQLPGAPPAAVTEQLTRFGAEVLGPVRAAMSAAVGEGRSGVTAAPG
jgi:alkanesulfonate monooxygenase SsuD/methylene tetrahydromethanopterin reductase-like flavin-dependent oxidoreductase (luciferase family)